VQLPQEERPFLPSFLKTKPNMQPSTRYKRIQE
jgi:hypothetical protein